jgi:hypothetical protein
LSLSTMLPPKVCIDMQTEAQSMPYSLHTVGMRSRISHQDKFPLNMLLGK